MAILKKIQVLCIDIGTSSLKVAVIDEEGEILAFSRQIFLLKSTEHSALEWMKCVKKALFEFSRLNLNISAVCVSGNGPTIVGESGETLLWNANISSLQIDYRGESLFIPQILAFKKKYPEAWEKTTFVFSGSEYLIWKFTKNPLSILPEKRYLPSYWTCDELKKAGLDEAEISKLPEFVSPSSFAGNISPECASYLCAANIGINEETKVFCGAPDFISALVGTNTLLPGKMCDRAGSSEGINLCTKEPFFAPGIRTLPSVVPGLWNESVLLADSGAKFFDFKLQVERKTAHKIDFDTLVHNCIHCNSQNRIFGPGKLLIQKTAQSVSDGISLLRENFLFSNPGCENDFPGEMSVTGGQSRNDEWNQFKANACEIDIKTSFCKDAELVGDAVFAFTGLKKFASIQQAAEKLCRVSKTFSPEL